MFSYRAYGLNLHSELELPELPASDAPPEVFICLGRLEMPPIEERFAEGRDFVRFDDLGKFLIRDGREIIVDPSPEVTCTQVRLVLLGRVMAWLLHQRGILALHGSGVALAGRAVAFLGDSGMGKSTTATAFYRHGHRLLTDDIAAFRAVADGYEFIPSYPHLRLLPEVTPLLEEAAGAALPFRPQLHKRGYDLAHGFCDTPLPLHRCYVLADGPRLQLQRLAPKDSFWALFDASFTRPWRTAPATHARYFQHWTQLAKTVPVYRLTRPRTLSGLADLVKLVEDDVNRDG